jgi:SNF2 family DNA or RNA helicase
VTNYEAVLGIGAQLDRCQWDVIVADESTKLKNGTARRTKGVIRLSKTVPHRFLLTGTPMTENPLGIFSQYLFLDGGRTFGKSFTGFRSSFFDSDYMGWNWTLKPDLRETFEERIADRAFRITKDKCLDLPPKVYEVQHAKMTKKQQKAYKSMREELLVELEGVQITAPVILTKLIKLTQITSGFLYSDDGKMHSLGSGKAEVLKELFEELRPHPIVVWCRYKHDVRLATELAQSLEIPTFVLTGESSFKQREAALTGFQKQGGVFIGQIRAGGMGINLSCASHVVYFSNEYSLEARLQSEDRCHRPGQKNKVVYVDLIVPNTIDEAILRALQSKKSLSDELMGSVEELAAKI